MQAYLGEARVSKYFWPERLAFVDELPRNPVGKVQKNLLRERVAELVATGGGLTAPPSRPRPSDPSTPSTSRESTA